MLKYRARDAKAYAREHLRGVWAAAPTPFRPEDLALDEAGLRRNLRHWIGDLGIGGLFISGKQGELFSMSVAERKRTFEIAVEETAALGNRSGTILSCSDQNLDTVVELARHAQAIGADYIVVHAPLLHFGRDVDDTVFAYYEHIAAQVDIGIAMWSHEDAGYLMSPALCARIARAIPNIVAIISKAAPVDCQGAMLGLNTAAGALARICGPLVAAPLFTGIGPSAPFAVAAGLCLPALFMAWRVSKAVRRSA